jgi:hypothetical protein
MFYALLVQLALLPIRDGVLPHNLLAFFVQCGVVGFAEDADQPEALEVRPLSLWLPPSVTRT